MSDPSPRRPARWWLALPWVVLLGWLAWLGADVLAARQLADAAWVASRVDGVDAHRRPRHEPVVLAPATPGAVRVWVLGSSTIVPRVPGGEHPLRAALRARGVEAVVDDLALDGMPSWEEVDRLKDAFAEADRQGVRPDVLVFYGECNDVTYTFHLGLQLPHFDAITGLAWVLSGEAFAARSEGDTGHTYWHYGHRRAPRLLATLQQAGLLTLDPAAFQPFRDRVHRVFEEDVDALIALATARGVEVLLVPPVSDLEAEPFGPVQTATALWRKGLATTDPAERLATLAAARDAETFSPDMRVDGAMAAALLARGTPDGPVRACDPAARLVADGGPIPHERFVDAVHLDEQGYARLIDTLAGCLAEAPRLAAAGGAR